MIRRLSPTGRLGLAILGLVVLGAALAPLCVPFDPNAIAPAEPLLSPSLRHPLGTDDYGRDLLSRILHGGRRSLLIAGGAVLVAGSLGGGLGLAAGLLGGALSRALLFLADVLLAFPVVLLCLMLLAFLDRADGGGAPAMILAIGVVYLAPFIRVGRAAALQVASEEYVLAARAVGVGPGRLLLRHILPGAAAPLVTEAGLRLAQALLTEAGLSFLGLGAQPPDASWGAMIAQGRRALSLSPWGCVAPGVALVITVLGCNLLADGVRDALDPRRR